MPTRDSSFHSTRIWIRVTEFIKTLTISVQDSVFQSWYICDPNR